MELAEAVGVSYQQIQKYEKETSRLSLGRLFLIAKALDTPVQSFLAERTALHFSERAEYPAPDPEKAGIAKDERALLHLFRDIDDAAVKRSIIRLVQSIAEQHANRQS
jgi:transcriptional regulator with XRE-family HTH domain